MNKNSAYKRHLIGQAAEDIACHYLQQQGLKLIDRNFQCKLGEIDLIMDDKKVLVFVEVRTRSNKNFVSALESVDFRKQEKIKKTASFYLLQKKLTNKVPCRFDVIAVQSHSDSTQFQWIKNAF